jgi:hypothetical protein
LKELPCLIVYQCSKGFATTELSHTPESPEELRTFIEKIRMETGSTSIVPINIITFQLSHNISLQTEEKIDHVYQMLNPQAQNRIEEAFRIANNALYFDDGSDFRSSLHEICWTLMPDNKGHEGKVFLSQESEAERE